MKQDPLKEYLEVNQKSWNDRVDFHLDSEMYDMKAFTEGKSSLNEPELKILGDISGKNVLHLQCHFGQDTLSMSRMGASCTGVDLSDKAIETAKELNARLGLKAEFVQSDVYSSPEKINKKYDIVYSTYGTIGWLPDIKKWAATVSHFLKPGGRLILIEFHPTLWMFDDDFEKIAYCYFNDEAIVETTTGTYADRDADLIKKEISWNHGLAEIMTALMTNGLSIKRFEEYDYSCYDCFPGMEKIGENKYRLLKFGNKMPLMYSIEAIKK